MFRVVADQLKISEGWVRCGHCADVFDATLHLQPWTASDAENDTPEDMAEAVPEPMPPQASPPDAQDGVLDALPDDATAAVEPEDVPEHPSGEDERTLETLPPPDHLKDAEPDEVESDFHDELERFAAGLGRLSTAHSINASAGSSVEAAPAASTMAAIPEAPAPRELDHDVEDAADSEQDEPIAEPGFVRQARRQAFWRRPAMRIALSLLALVLAALLAGQWAVQQRDRLAAWQPALQPLLQQACTHLGCSLAPVHRIDAIVIDSTSLVNRLGDFYSFDLVLKNTAAMALAVPALELSITDIGGSVIARRVFLPAEWPDAPAVLPALASVTVSFRLALAVGDTAPMAGYNALIFYP